MYFRQLKYFVAISQHGSITAAAEFLHMSQPALTVQLANLEAQLGCQLVLRSAKGIRLTEAGEVFLSKARTILDMVKETHRAVQAAATRVTRLRIGIPPIVSRWLTIPLLNAVDDEFKDVTLEVQELMTGAIKALLANGELDLAVISGSREDEFPHAWKICEEDLYFGVRVGGALKPKRTMSFADLENVPIISTTRSNHLTQLLEQLADANETTLKIVAEINSTSRMFDYVQKSDCGVVGPRSLFDGFPKGRLSVSKLIGHGVDGSWKSFVVFPSTSECSDSAKRVGEIVQDIIIENISRSKR